MESDAIDRLTEAYDEFAAALASADRPNVQLTSNQWAEYREHLSLLRAARASIEKAMREKWALPSILSNVYRETTHLDRGRVFNASPYFALANLREAIASHLIDALSQNSEDFSRLSGKISEQDIEIERLRSSIYQQRTAFLAGC